MMKSVTVRMASGSPVLAESLSGGTASKGVSKLELTVGENKSLKIGDKKAAFDSAATFVITNNSDKSVATADIIGGVLSINALKEGKTTITVQCIQSGKTVKVTVTCKAAEGE